FGCRTASTRSSLFEPSSPATMTTSLSPLFEDEFCSNEIPCEPYSDDDRNRCARTDPRAGRLVCAGTEDDADRGPDHGAGGGGRSHRHRLSPFPVRGKHCDVD